MNSILKKITLFLLILITIFFLTEWIIRGIYIILFSSHTFLTFVSPMLHLTKYFIVATIIILIIKKYFTLEQAGAIIIPIFLVVSIGFTLTSALWFNAANEEKIVKHRIVWHSVKTWDDVEYVSTEIEQENRVVFSDTNTLTPLKIYTRYTIHFLDGTAINVWDNLSSVDELHQFVLDNKISVAYLSASEDFDKHYGSYFKKDLSKAHAIFGIKNDRRIE